MMKTIPLTKGKKAIVDDRYYKILSRFNWYATKSAFNWYAARIVTVSPGQREKIYMHRFIMRAKKGQEVHHKDTHSLNNQRHNLELTSKSGNLEFRKPRGPNKWKTKTKTKQNKPGEKNKSKTTDPNWIL